MKYKNPLLLLMFVLVFAGLAVGCSGSTGNSTPSSRDADLPTLVLAEAGEPGQHLILYGSVVDGQTGQAIPEAEVYIYHADANGEYQPVDPKEESTARLSGEIVTNAAGEFAVETIVPREYDQPGNRHIHLEYVRADGYQNGGGVILFEKDVNDEVRQWANETGFGTIITLEDMDGVQQGSVVIVLERED